MACDKPQVKECNNNVMSYNTIAYVQQLGYYLCRLFLQQLPEKCKKHRAKVIDALITEDSLKDFKVLCEKNLNWNSAKKAYVVKNSELPLDSPDESNSPPPTKRQKM